MSSHHYFVHAAIGHRFGQFSHSHPLSLAEATSSSSNSWLRCLNHQKRRAQYGLRISDVRIMLLRPGSCVNPLMLVTHDGKDTITSSDPGSDIHEYPCLVRVTNGKQVNFSTRVRAQSRDLNACLPSHYEQVEPGHLNQFHAAYGALLKSSMSSFLRKRDKKREKQRAEESIRRKRRLAEDIVIEGVKRGNGRRKRQQLMKRAIRQEGTRKRVHEREETRLNKAKSSST